MIKRKAVIKKTTDGMKIKSRIGVGKKGKTTTRTTNAKGKITSVTKTKADGTTRTLGKEQLAARNRLKSGEGAKAVAAREKITDLRKQKREAKKSGNTDLVKALRKEKKATRKTFMSSVKTKRNKAANKGNNK